MNILKLKGKIVEKDLNNASFAEKIGLTTATFYRRLENNGKDFTIGEVERMVQALEITPNEAIEIFLSEKSHK